MLQLYNPYNPKNRLFTKTDIQAILIKHNCDHKVDNVQLFQTAMVHTSYVIKNEVFYLLSYIYIIIKFEKKIFIIYKRENLTVLKIFIVRISLSYSVCHNH